MNKILGNSQGFVQLLVAILVVVVGVTGFYLYSSGKLPIILAPITKQTPPATQQTPPAVTLQENPLTKNWKTFESKELGISFKYPEGLGTPKFSDNFYIYFEKRDGTEGIFVRSLKEMLGEGDDPLEIKPHIKSAVPILESVSKNILTEDLKDKIRINEFIGGGHLSEVYSIKTIYAPESKIYGLETIIFGGYSGDPQNLLYLTQFLKNDKLFTVRFSFFPITNSTLYFLVSKQWNTLSLPRELGKQLDAKQFTNDEIGQTLKKNLEIYEAIAQSVKFLN